MSGAARGGTRVRAAAAGGRLPGRSVVGGRRAVWGDPSLGGLSGTRSPGAAGAGVARGVQGWSGGEGLQNVDPSPAEVYFGARLH